MRRSHIAALVSLAIFAAAPVQAQDAAAGEKIFRKCAACHQVGDGAKNKVGPVLTDVLGRVEPPTTNPSSKTPSRRPI